MENGEYERTLVEDLQNEPANVGYGLGLKPTHTNPDEFLP
jgi:hypothetical protein